MEHPQHGHWRALRRFGLRGAVVFATLMTTAAAANAATSITVLSPGRSPQVGIQDDRIGYVADPAERVRAMADAGASIVRVDVRWDQIAKLKPVNPTDPADPGYDWAAYDRVVDAAVASKVELLFAVYGTPDWAVDPTVVQDSNTTSPIGKASFAPADPADFGRFARAIATRYAPRGVTKWEAWNEPQIVLFLQPQYKYEGGRWRPASPQIYSGLLKEFYAGIKAVSPTATVAGAVTSPAGDRCVTSVCDIADDQPNRIIPMDFIRLLNAPALRPPMDVVSHHPYPVRLDPSVQPKNPSYSDIYNLDVMFKAIDSTYLKGKKVWLTEWGFSTAKVPEYTTVVSPAKQATNISEVAWRLRQTPRVTLGVYYLFQDHPGWRSGIVSVSGAKKPGYQAYAMPLHGVRTGRDTVVFGQVRAGEGKTKVTIQRLARGRWVTAKRLTTAKDGSYRIRVRTTQRVTLRATWTGTSRSGATVTRLSRSLTVRAS